MSKKTRITKDELSQFLKNHTNKQAAIHFETSIKTITRRISEYGLSYEVLKYGDFPPITKFQNELIVASLLGDGTVDKYGRFKIKQTKNKEAYILWMKKELNPYTHKMFNEQTKLRDKTHKCVGTYTMNHSFFKNLRKEWYPNNVKIIPRNLILTPRIFAHWFFQDGSNNQGKKSIQISTNCFSVLDVQFLIKIIKKHLDIQASLNFQKGQPIIRIGAYEYEKTLKLIANFVEWDCFAYKIDTNKVRKKKNIKSGACKLNKSKAREIRVLFNNENTSVMELSAKFGVSISSIYNILHNITYPDRDFSKVYVIHNPKVN